MSGDHLGFFATNLEPIDDDLEGTIQGYESVKLEGEQFDKVNRDFLKMIDTLNRRNKCYGRFERRHKIKSQS